MENTGGISEQIGQLLVDPDFKGMINSQLDFIMASQPLYEQGFVPQDDPGETDTRIRKFFEIRSNYYANAGNDIFAANDNAQAASYFETKEEYFGTSAEWFLCGIKAYQSIHEMGIAMLENNLHGASVPNESNLDFRLRRTIELKKYIKSRLEQDIPSNDERIEELGVTGESLLGMLD